MAENRERKSDDRDVMMSSTLLLNFHQACVNLSFYLDEDMRRLVEGVKPDDWCPINQLSQLIGMVAARYDRPSPIIEQIGVEMMRAWYEHGPGHEIVKRGVDFLRYQASSQGYSSVVRGPRDKVGEFVLQDLDELAGTAAVFSSTPFDKDMERGILLGGLRLAGDLSYIEIDNSEDPLRYHIRFASRVPRTTTAPEPIDAEAFLYKPDLSEDRMLSGVQLHRVFWRYRALQLELNRMREFWESTNETLARSFRLVQDKEQELRESYAALEQEREKSERLLLNILPMSIALRLKEQPSAIAAQHPAVTIFFADVVDFTQLSGRISAAELIAVLNQMFSLFDEIAERRGIEKIKTIGDAYMAVSNLTVPREDHVAAMADLALEIRQRMGELPEACGKPICVRMGIHTGPVVAGVIGTTKFSYDVWGDTVNIASRIESYGLPREIQVSSDVYKRLHDRYEFGPPRTLNVKYRGEIQAYILRGRRV
ncbi:MAG: hypothetical protein MJE77_25280 [Proteobacteria bacterium]|nr:hypothetical protein [Pseudomonadota bacterium]